MEIYARQNDRGRALVRLDFKRVSSFLWDLIILAVEPPMRGFQDEIQSN
jgi:hypothetical protein